MSLGLDTVTAMIAPALFMTATGSLLMSTSVRMARIVDRIRVLIEADEAATRHPSTLDFPLIRRRHIAQQLRQLQWRSNRVMVAVTMLYASLAAFAATSMAIALDSLLGHHFIVAAIVLAIVGVGLLLIACANLVLEARLALSSNHLEISYHTELSSMRLAEHTPSPSARATPDR